jgi:hypothetical protein
MVLEGCGDFLAFSTLWNCAILTVIFCQPGWLLGFLSHGSTVTFQRSTCHPVSRTGNGSEAAVRSRCKPRPPLPLNWESNLSTPISNSPIQSFLFAARI